MSDSVQSPSNKPTKAEVIARRRGEVCALGRAIRALDAAPHGSDPAAVLRGHYDKARKALRTAHQIEAAPEVPHPPR